MNEQNVLCPYNEGSFDNKRMKNSYMIQYGWALKTSCEVKAACHKTSCTVGFHLQEISRIGKPRETECRLAVL